MLKAEANILRITYPTVAAAPNQHGVFGHVDSDSNVQHACEDGFVLVESCSVVLSRECARRNTFVQYPSERLLALFDIHDQQIASRHKSFDLRTCSWKKHLQYLRHNPRRRAAWYNQETQSVMVLFIV